MTFYQIVTLASIVEHEAIVDEERPLIAGVYQNRLDGLHGVARILNADPTVTYATDTMALEELPFEEWQDYFFWKVPPSPLADVQVDPRRCRATRPTRSRASSRARSRRRASPRSTPRSSRTRTDGYLYFVAIPDTQDARLRQDARGAQREPAQVRLPE